MSFFYKIFLIFLSDPSLIQDEPYLYTEKDGGLLGSLSLSSSISLDEMETLLLHFVCGPGQVVTQLIGVWVCMCVYVYVCVCSNCSNIILAKYSFPENKEARSWYVQVRTQSAITKSPSHRGR